MSKKYRKSKKSAFDFFKDNYTMIRSLESSEEKGCAERCLGVIEDAVRKVEEDKKDKI